MHNPTYINFDNLYHGLLHKVPVDGANTTNTATTATTNTNTNTNNSIGGQSWGQDQGLGTGLGPGSGIARALLDIVTDASALFATRAMNQVGVYMSTHINP